MNKLAAALLVVAPLMAGANFDSSHWRYRRAISARAEPSAVAVVTPDVALYSHTAPGFYDLRIVSQSLEVPYVLERMGGSRQHTETGAPITDQGVTAASDLELTVDAGVNRRHNAIRVATEKTNFRQQVTVATSGDGQTWTRIRNNGFIFDFSQEAQRVSVLRVTYPLSTRRYVRIIIHGWKDPDAISQAWLSFDEESPPVRDVVASLNASGVDEPKTKSTLLTWDLGGVPYNALEVKVGTPEFQRAALVEASADKQSWREIDRGVLSRYGGEESLLLTFPETRDRYLRLHIFNRDDRPLTVESAHASITRTRIKFRPTGNAPHWLYYGNDRASAPSYDLGELLAHGAPTAEASASLGAEEPNPAFQETPSAPLPWTERHPAALYSVLAVAVLVMGAFTFRLLRKVNAG